MAMIEWFRQVASTPQLMVVAVFICWRSKNDNWGKEEVPEDKKALFKKLDTAITTQEMNDAYKALGQEGCKAYVARADPFLIQLLSSLAYMSMFGAIAVFVTEDLGINETPWAYLPVVTAAADLIKKFIRNQGCLYFPAKLPYAVLVTVIVAKATVAISWLSLTSLTLWGFALKGCEFFHHMHQD